MILPDMLIDIVCEALRKVDPDLIQLSPLRYDGRSSVSYPKYQERTFAYEFYHQLRKLQEAERSELESVTQQGEVSKVYQGIPIIPDLLLHVPGQTTMNLAAFEFKLAENREVVEDLSKLQRMKRDFGYREAFMIILGSLSAAQEWLAIARTFRSPRGQEVHFIIYDPSGLERVPHTEVIPVNVPNQ